MNRTPTLLVVAVTSLFACGVTATDVGDEPSRRAGAAADDAVAPPEQEEVAPPASGGESGSESDESSDGGSGGSSSGGSSSGGSTGTPSQGTSGACSLTYTGGTGNEAGGVIPVCCAPTATEKADVDEVFRLLNAYRASKGKAPVTYDPELEASVQGHCLHMSEHGFFSHSSPESSVRSSFKRGPLCGATVNAEIIAKGQTSPERAMSSWRNSPGHNAVMLGSYTRVGIGHAGPYWAQVFGN